MKAGGKSARTASGARKPALARPPPVDPPPSKTLGEAQRLPGDRDAWASVPTPVDRAGDGAGSVQGPSSSTRRDSRTRGLPESILTKYRGFGGANSCCRVTSDSGVASGSCRVGEGLGGLQRARPISVMTISVMTISVISEWPASPAHISDDHISDDHISDDHFSDDHISDDHTSDQR